MARRFKVNRWVDRSRAVLVPRLAKRTVLADYVTCSEPLQQESGEAQWALGTLYHQGALLVIVSSGGFTFGQGVAVASVKTSTGYTFSGNTCMGTTGDSCSNGKLKATITSVQGEINTTKSPETIDYTYTIELYCGSVLSCVENGTFKGSRYAASSKPPEGSWLGTQKWSVECCGSRYKLK